MAGVGSNIILVILHVATDVAVLTHVHFSTVKRFRVNTVGNGPFGGKGVNLVIMDLPLYFKHLADINSCLLSVVFNL